MKSILERALREAVERIVSDASKDLPPLRLTRPKTASHGDYACNIAMPLASRLRRPPREVAEEILAVVAWPEAVARAEIAGPGFINIHLCSASEAEVVRRIVRQGADYGRRQAPDAQNICLEFVSANPTGPMHIGHGRGAVLGDSLARLLDSQGHKVTREYYINDAGAQIGVLARSVWLRMRELQGEEIEFPDSAYPGSYIVDIARVLLEEQPIEDWRAMDEDERLRRIGERAVEENMRAIRQDLAMLDIHFDVFFSERRLHESGRIDALIQRLQDEELVYTGVLPAPKGKDVEDYQPQPQLLFRTTDFGDDVDRPLRKQDGSPTYFAADIAYHEDKLKRGFERMIDVWGADHGGYIRRVQAAVKALSGLEDQPDVLLVQMVNLTRAGRPVRMSKRAGTFVTLEEVVREVGADAVRFNFMTRRAESQFDFDLEEAKLQSDENPVYYVQYAHARICAVLRRAEEEGIERVPLAECDVSCLQHRAEQELIAQLLAYPEMLQMAAERLEPYRVAGYAMKLAAGFHAFYHRCRVVQKNDRNLTQARLLLAEAVAQVLRNALGILGVRSPERM